MPSAKTIGQRLLNFTKDCAMELVGDDLLATNIQRVKMAEEKKVCNSSH